MLHLHTFVLLAGITGQSAVVLDRIAVVVNNRIVKDSDIDRDIRVTALLNGDRFDLGPPARKQAASRLIDQALIRREMEVAQYPPAKPEEAQQVLERARKQRYGSDAVYKAALEQYGITEGQLRRQVEWQTTVLHFIEQRFRPGVLISDQETQQYFQQHSAELRRGAGGKTVSLEEVRDTIEQQLAGERVNQQFFAWLEQARKEATIKYLEPELK
jgi:peptidyl-prolyl cis-trans isomerase SurA